MLLCLPTAPALPLKETETSVGPRFLGNSRTSYCLAFVAYMGVPDVNHQSGWKIKALNLLAQGNGHSDAAPPRDDLEKVVRGCAVRVHSAANSNSIRSLRRRAYRRRVPTPIASGRHLATFALWAAISFFSPLSAFHSVLGLRRHSMKRTSYVRSNREMRSLTEA